MRKMRPQRHFEPTGIGAAAPPGSTNDQPNFARNCKYRSSSIAISAVHTDWHKRYLVKKLQALGFKVELVPLKQVA